jgi:hypothetical protein
MAASLAFHMLRVFLQPHQKVHPALAAPRAAKYLINQVFFWFSRARAVVLFHGVPPLVSGSIFITLNRLSIKPFLQGTGILTMP